MKTGFLLVLVGVCFNLAFSWACAQPANDNFADGTVVTGTNITFYVSTSGATSETGEPFNGAPNTVWMSWTPPADGYGQVTQRPPPQFPYYAIYAGPRVDMLQPVNLVPLGHDSAYRFLATAGTVYHFQFSGTADNFAFSLLFGPMLTCTNDDFANAQVVQGQVIYFPGAWINNATMELGEPAHMGDIAQKSIWWKWQAPLWGQYYLNPKASLVTNYVIAAYTGDSVEALTLAGKSTNNTLLLAVTGGQTYYLATATPTNAIGDISMVSQYASRDTSAHSIPGNLLQEPSWEGTGLLGAHFWHWSDGLGGYVDEPGGADGSTWPTLATGTAIWQDFPTVPGHAYTVRFAWELDNGGGDAQVAVVWDASPLGTSVIPASEGSWHWVSYAAIASNTTPRVTFQNLARMVGMDAFSVVDASAAPSIVTQPASLSSIVGGTAVLIVGVDGTAPLSYQWCFNQAPLDEQTNKMLVLTYLAEDQAGDYQVIITNAFGAVTSAVASLLVDAPVNATILSQPYGDTVPAGGYFNFTVVAAGTPPLSYLWFLNDQAISDATNCNLMLTNVQPDDAGVYALRVRNQSSTVWSLPATLTVVQTNLGGGKIDFRNQLFPSGGTNANAPVFDLDGVTPLKGSGYVAQLYAGPSLALLRPAGQPTPFQDGFSSGYFVPQLITLANVMPGSNAVVQVCAWDAACGTSYEQARATGGRFGKSSILQVTVGGGGQPPRRLQGLQSFSLQAGLPFFEVGTIAFVERQPPNTIVWALHGQPGSLYLIEKSERSKETVWHPFTVITNVTGTVTFTDTANSGNANVWYRARILD